MPPPATAAFERRAGVAVVSAFALSTILFTGSFPPFANPNELSRLETVFAFVETGTFQIDRAIPILGDHEDKAAAGGHFYSNKAPGLALAAAPVYRALRIFFPRPRSAFDPVFVWLRLLTVSWVCVLALARFHARLLREGFAAAALVTAAAGFGTSYLFYSRSFLSHAWTAALLLLSWDLVKLFEDWRFRRRGGILLIGAGFLAGWAAISEYPVALVTALLAARVASGRSWRRAAVFAGGAAVPLAVLLAYDAVCFGSPFVLSSSREALSEYAAVAGRGLFGIGPPRANVALAYLFHPARGALLFSPFLLWTAAGFVRSRKLRYGREDGWLCVSATLLYFLVLCGYPNWHGGWALGDRYLLPVLFFATLGAARALGTPLSRWLFAVAVVFSIVVHFLMTASWPYFPLNVVWPPATASLWFLGKGWVAPATLAAPSVALAISGLATAAAVAFSLAAAQLSRKTWWLTPIVAAVPLALLLAAPRELPFGARLWRAAVFGRYSGRDPSRDELQKVIAEAGSDSERRRARDAWQMYGK